MASKSTSTAQELFCEAVDAELAGNTSQAADIYKKLIENQPDYAPAYVNMGTLYFQRHLLDMAAAHYRKATEIQPDYCLAHYNYAIASEDMGRHDEAISAYLRAIEINPKHCDSHFNLALAYQRQSQNRKALPHWQAYLAYASNDHKSDLAARGEMRKILALDPMKVVFSNDKPARTFNLRPTLGLIKSASLGAQNLRLR